MKDTNKYGIYWISKKDDKTIDHGLICTAEDKEYAEHVKDALDNLNVDKTVEFIIAIDYSLI